MISKFALVVYLLFILWFVVTVSLVVPIIGYYMVIKNCEFKKNQIEAPVHQKVDECISLLTYGIQLNENKHSVCSTELITFCNQVCFKFKKKILFTIS